MADRSSLPGDGPSSHDPGLGWVDLTPPRRVVGVFAHPDDEVLCAGGTMAKWAEAGSHITVVSATSGEAGQIRDAAVAVRRTLGRVREEELQKSCAALGVQHSQVLGYHDGRLQQVPIDDLTARVEAVLAEVDPDVVITFDEDGAYGHPDHVAIGVATVAAVARRWRTIDGKPTSGPLLWKSHFPSHEVSLADRLASWLVTMGDGFDGSTDYGRALTLFAEESTTMRFASDDVKVSWFPPGSMIVEQGEAADSLCLILSGSVEVVEESEGSSHLLAELAEGKFFGELGIAYRQPRSASVIAKGNVTCLVLSPSKPTLWAGRGTAAQPETTVLGRDATTKHPEAEAIRIDVAAHVEKKLSALAAHRSQYPIDVNAFPISMLTEMYGMEYFIAIDSVQR